MNMRKKDERRTEEGNKRDEMKEKKRKGKTRKEGREGEEKWGGTIIHGKGRRGLAVLSFGETFPLASSFQPLLDFPMKRN